MDELKSFTCQIDGWIDGVLEKLGWTREGLLQTETKRECPLSTEHVMDGSVLERHLKYCPLLAKGYTKDELEREQSSKFFYEDAPCVLTLELDERAIGNILATTGDPIPESLPQTIRRSITTLTVEQRLKIYEYCVEACRASNVQNRINSEDLALFDNMKEKEDKPQTKMEMLAKMRDLKRRRQSYKGKNTHTGKKSQTEIIRDVVANQMEILSRIWEEERLEKEAAKNEREKEERERERASRGKSENRESHQTKHEASRERHESRDRRRSRGRKHSRERQRRSGERKRSRDKEQGKERQLSVSQDQHETKSDRKRQRSGSNDRRKHKKHKRSKESRDDHSKDRHFEEDSKDVRLSQMSDANITTVESLTETEKQAEEMKRPFS